MGKKVSLFGVLGALGLIILLFIIAMIMNNSAGGDLYDLMLRFGYALVIGALIGVLLFAIYQAITNFKAALPFLLVGLGILAAWFIGGAMASDGLQIAGEDYSAKITNNLSKLSGTGLKAVYLIGGLALILFLLDMVWGIVRSFFNN